MVGEDEGEAALEADEGAAAGAAEVGAGIAVIEAAEENAAGSRAFPIKNTALHPGARHTRAPLFLSLRSAICFVLRYFARWPYCIYSYI